MYKNLVSDQTAENKNLMNELKLYHWIGNFYIQIQLNYKHAKKIVSWFMAFDR